MLKKKKRSYFQTLDNLVIFLCRTIQGGQQLFKWNASVFFTPINSNQKIG